VPLQPSLDPGIPGPKRDWGFEPLLPAFGGALYLVITRTSRLGRARLQLS